MNRFTISREGLEEIIEKSVSKSLIDILPEAIEKGVRKKWLTTNEVMQLLRCSKRHVQYLRDSGRLPFYKLGRSIRYDIEVIESLLIKGGNKND